MTDKQILRVKTQITEARRALSAEKRKYGWYDDSYGRRYVIGELYLKIQDFKGLARYHTWFYKEFEDDIGGPELLLAWGVGFISLGKKELAALRIAELENLNSYLLPILVGQDTGPIDKYEWANYAQHDYAVAVANRLTKMIPAPVIKTLEQVYQDPAYLALKEELVETYRLIKSMPSGPERTHLRRKQKALKPGMEARLLELL